MFVDPNTLPQPAGAVMSTFISKLSRLLPGVIEGVYLTGSIPLQDYHSAKSDIDFIVVLKELPGVKSIVDLEKTHRDLEKKYHRPKLHGYYFTVEGLRTETCFASFFGKKIEQNKQLENDSILLYELRTASYTLYGTPIADLPVTINIEEVKARLRRNINSYWANWIKRHSGCSIGYFVLFFFPKKIEWGILGVARQFYTLEKGEITSKSRAGEYYLDKIPLVWQPAVLDAIKARRMNKFQVQPSTKRARETLNCMRFFIDSFNQQVSN